MARGRRPSVVLLSSGDTLRPVGSAAKALGLRWSRVEAIRIAPEPEGRVAARLRRLRRVEGVVVTSRHAALPALVRWANGQPKGGRPVFWAVGPGTADHLRACGAHEVREGRTLGADGLLRRLGPRPRRLLYVRSDVAGDRVARALRARRHRVSEVLGYRVLARPREIRQRRGVIEAAQALVVASPSSLAALRYALGARRVRALGRTIPAIVLGELSARAARDAGFCRVVVAPTSDPQRFARALVGTLTDVGA